MGASGPRAPVSVRWVVFVAVLAVLAFVAAIAMQRNVFPFYSGDHDEPVYRLQAEMLREGIVTLPRTQNEFFRPWLSAPRDDHLVLAFSPGWPSVLMVGDVLGSMLIALGAVAALTVVAGFAFAREMLGSSGRAALATVILALSPFVLMLSGTYLNYVFALALYLVFGALLLRALRSRSTVLLVLSGLVLGAAFLTRPYDALLFALPFAGYIVATRRHELRTVAPIAGWIGLGALPAVVTTVAYNLATTGSPFEFPVTAQSGGYSVFGWGVRGIAADTSTVDYTVRQAFESMWANLSATPTWLFGTYLTLGLAIFGAVRLWRTDRSLCALLIGLTVVFPIGYLAWWASFLTTAGARNGVGPHYYLPMLIPLAVLAAHGTAELAARRRGVLIGGLVAAVVLTVIALPPKIGDKQRTEDHARSYADRVTDGLRQRDGKPALVIQERQRAPYILDPYPFLANPPDLQADVLYATDHGAHNIELLDRRPDRRGFRLVRETVPGGELDPIPVVVKPQAVLRAPELTFRTTIINPSGLPTVTAYARVGDREERRLLDTASTKGERYDVTWTVTPDGITYAGPPARPMRTTQKNSRGLVVIGATYGKSPAARDPDAAERRYYARVARGTEPGMELLTADEEWTRFGTPIHAWLPISVDSGLKVVVRGRKA